MTQIVYILHCADAGVYIGCTEDLNERINISFQDKYKAFAFEKYLKSGSGRAFLKKHFF